MSLLYKTDFKIVYINCKLFELITILILKCSIYTCTRKMLHAGMLAKSNITQARFKLILTVNWEKIIIQC